MHCTNPNDVASWWQELQSKDITVTRYTDVPIEDVTKFDIVKVLRENLDEWLCTGEHYTFWHLKQLMIDLKDNDTKIPVVATRLDGNLFVDPGGSRLTVMNHLGKKVVDVDVIYPTKHLDELALGEGEHLQDYQTLLEPYEKMGVKYSMEMCFDKECVTCRNNKVTHNGAYRYSVTWDRAWFYGENYKEWYEKNKDTEVENKMDWYKI